MTVPSKVAFWVEKGQQKRWHGLLVTLGRTERELMLYWSIIKILIIPSTSHMKFGNLVGGTCAYRGYQVPADRREGNPRVAGGELVCSDLSSPWRPEAVVSTPSWKTRAPQQESVSPDNFCTFSKGLSAQSTICYWAPASLAAISALDQADTLLQLSLLNSFLSKTHLVRCFRRDFCFGDESYQAENSSKITSWIVLYPEVPLSLTQA